MNILVTSIVDLKKTSHNRLHQFVKFLSKNNDITILSINDWWKSGQTDMKLYTVGFEDMFKRIKIIYLTKRRISPILQEVFSVMAVNKFKEIDYEYFDVHFNYNTLISGYSIAKKMNSIGINTVYDIADDLPGMIRTSPQIPCFLRPLGGLIGDKMVKKNIEIAKRIIFTTSSLKRPYTAYQNKFKVLPNGVDTDLFRNYHSHLREELSIEQDFVIGYVGILREWVDFEPVFAAVKELSKRYSNIKILIIGEEGKFKENKELAERYGILNRVIFTKTVPYTEVPKYISCMDVCVIPFKLDAVSQNSLPLKLFEYMACEKPVISTEVEGIMAAVQNRVLYASNSEEYRNKIIELYNNEALRTEMGLNGRKFVGKNYSWSKIALELEGVLNEVGGG